MNYFSMSDDMLREVLMQMRLYDLSLIVTTDYRTSEIIHEILKPIWKLTEYFLTHLHRNGHANLKQEYEDTEVDSDDEPIKINGPNDIYPKITDIVAETNLQKERYRLHMINKKKEVFGDCCGMLTKIYDFFNEIEDPRFETLSDIYRYYVGEMFGVYIIENDDNIRETMILQRIIERGICWYYSSGACTNEILVDMVLRNNT